MSKYVLKYSADKVDSPIISNVVLETGAMLNILKAEIGYDEATIIVEILGGEKDKKKAVNAFEKYGIDIRRLTGNIINDIHRCVDCGACITLCPVNAISFDEKWSIQIDDDKCIRCGICVKACPRRSLAIQEY